MTPPTPLYPTIKIKEKKPEVIMPSDFGSGTTQYSSAIKAETTGLGVGFGVFWIIVIVAGLLLSINPLNWDLKVSESTPLVPQRSIVDHSSEQCPNRRSGYNVGITPDGTCYVIEP